MDWVLPRGELSELHGAQALHNNLPSLGVASLVKVTSLVTSLAIQRVFTAGSLVCPLGPQSDNILNIL